MRIILLLLILVNINASSDLDVSSLPKHFRELHVRIVGDGYLRFLVPTSMDSFADSGDDEEKIYIDNALGTYELPDDPFALKSFVVKEPARCLSSDNIHPKTDVHQTEAKNCKDVFSSCVRIHDMYNDTLSIYETDPKSCKSILGSCMQKTGESRWAAAYSASVPVAGWDVKSPHQGSCISTRTIMLNGAVAGFGPGDILSQDFGDIDGNIQGTIHDIEMGGASFVLKDIVGKAGTDGRAPVDFKKASDGGSNVRFIKEDGTVSYTTKYIVAKVVQERHFSPAVVRKFQPFLRRTFVPAKLENTSFTHVYSRYGLLHVNKYRLLVNVNGLLVIAKTKKKNDGYIHVPNFYNAITIRQNGVVHVKYNDGTMDYIGQLVLSTFPNKYGLNVHGNSGFEIRCNGAGGFGTSLGSWCKNTNLEGKKIWYYAETSESGKPELKFAAPFTSTRIQQYHLNTDDKDLYLGGEEPTEIW